MFNEQIKKGLALVFAISRPFFQSRETGILRGVPGNPGISREIFLIKKALERVQISIQIWLFYITVTLGCLTLQLSLDFFVILTAFNETSVLGVN